MKQNASRTRHVLRGGVQRKEDSNGGNDVPLATPVTGNTIMTSDIRALDARAQDVVA